METVNGKQREGMSNSEKGGLALSPKYSLIIKLLALS